MQTKPRKSLFDKRGVNTQRIPYEENYGIARILRSRETYDSALTNQNQIELYDNFKMSMLKAQTASTVQNIIADTPIVRACMEKYVQTCSTKAFVSGGTRVGREMVDRLIGSTKFKETQDQAFRQLFKRGGFVLEAKFLESNGVFLLEEIKVHDLDRFSFELMPDPRYGPMGEKYGMALKNYVWNREVNEDLLMYPTIKKVVKGSEPGKKPVGRSRITSAVYMASVHLKIIDSIKNVFAKSGSPTLTASYNQQKLFGGEDDREEFFTGDINEWMRTEITAFTEKAKSLPEGDVLVVPGAIEIGDYLMPGTKMNVQGLEDFSHSLKIDTCLAVEVPPSVIGIVQKTSALNDTTTESLIKDFRDDCREDQEIVASAFSELVNYAAMRNELRQPMSNPLMFDFLFSNINAQRELYDIQKSKAETEAAIIANIQAAQQAGYIDEAEAAQRYADELAMLTPDSA